MPVPSTVGSLMQGMQRMGPKMGMSLTMPGTPQLPQQTAQAPMGPSGQASQGMADAAPTPWSQGDARSAWRAKVQDLKAQRAAGVKNPGREFWASGGKVAQPVDGGAPGLDMAAKRAGLRSMMGG